MRLITKRTVNHRKGRSEGSQDLTAKAVPNRRRKAGCGRQHAAKAGYEYSNQIEHARPTKRVLPFETKLRRALVCTW